MFLKSFHADFNNKSRQIYETFFEFSASYQFSILKILNKNLIFSSQTNNAGRNHTRSWHT
jgi:hypothetical protein